MKIWNFSKVVAAPFVIGALGVTSKRLKDWLKKSDEMGNKGFLHKAALLELQKIERKVPMT